MTHFTFYALDKIMGPNPMKVAAFLEALNLDYKVIELEMGSNDKTKGVKGAEFLKVCPNGRTPALIDHQNNDYTVWESGAILEYLAEKYDKDYKYSGKTVEERGIVREWLYFQVSGHSPIQGNLYFAKNYWKGVFNEDAPPTVIKRFHSELLRVFSVYEEQLQRQAEKYKPENAWLALDRPTIADFSVFGWLSLWPKLGATLDIDLAKYPHLAKYVERLLSLPATDAVCKRIFSA